MLRHVIAPLALLAFTACADIAAPPPPPLAAVSTAPRLAPEDLVRVIVFDEPRLSGEYRVSRAGTLTLPLIGTITAGNRTPYEVERAIESSMREAALHREPVAAVQLLGPRGAFQTALR